MSAVKKPNITREDLPRYSIKDWKLWEGKWELIEGIPYSMAPMPNKRHQRINGRIYRLFSEKLEQCENCEVYLPVNFKINKHNLLHPDLLVVCGEDASGMYVEHTPELVVEILSPSTRKKDLETKPKVYLALGIRYYLIIDPQEEWLQLMEIKNEQYSSISQKSRAFSFTFQFDTCKAEVDFGEIWG